MSQSESTATFRQTTPRCDRCARRMVGSGWTPRPDGHGGLCRIPVFTCPGCDRVYDEIWGHREGFRIGEN